MIDYLFLGMLLAAALGFGLAPLVVVRLIAPRRPSREKATGYECGVPSRGPSIPATRNSYAVYVLLFVLFDIETIYLFPWAVSYRGLGLFALIEMGIFLIMLGIGLAYAWGAGHLRWE